MNNVKSLKARQLNAIQLLALGTPAYQVAAQLEVSTMTIYRWQRLPEFEAKLNAITSSGLEEIAKKMNATTLTAVETLQEILCNMTEPSTTRMKAALGVLSAVASVNNMLEKSLKHRVADFDLQQRFSEQAFTFDGSGNRYPRIEYKPSESGFVEV
jgi:hypothetical protein